MASADGAHTPRPREGRSPRVGLPGEQRGEIANRPGGRAATDRQGRGAEHPVSAVERYLRGGLAVHVHFDLCIPDLEPKAREWCAVVYEPIPVAPRDQLLKGWTPGYGAVPDELDLSRVPAAKDCREDPVLVRVRQGLD